MVAGPLLTTCRDCEIQIPVEVVEQSADPVLLVWSVEPEQVAALVATVVPRAGPRARLWGSGVLTGPVELVTVVGLEAGRLEPAGPIPLIPLVSRVLELLGEQALTVPSSAGRGTGRVCAQSDE